MSVLLIKGLLPEALFFQVSHLSAELRSVDVCVQYGYGNNQYEWFIFLNKAITFLMQSLDGNVVVRSDARVSSLTLKYVKYTDAGQYLCTARSAIGEDGRLVYLEVRCKYSLH